MERRLRESGNSFTKYDQVYIVSFISSKNIGVNAAVSFMCNYNHGHNILRLFDVLRNLIFKKSKTKRDY